MRRRVIASVQMAENELRKIFLDTENKSAVTLRMRCGSRGSFPIQTLGVGLEKTRESPIRLVRFGRVLIPS